MLVSFSKGGAPAPALDRLRDWTRERFRLEPGDAVLATELACGVPGCPPLETVVAFWTADGGRYHSRSSNRPTRCGRTICPMPG
jgi:hypothetical protein